LKTIKRNVERMFFTDIKNTRHFETWTDVSK